MAVVGFNKIRNWTWQKYGDEEDLTGKSCSETNTKAALRHRQSAILNLINDD